MLEEYMFTDVHRVFPWVIHNVNPRLSRYHSISWKVPFPGSVDRSILTVVEMIRGKALLGPVGCPGEPKGIPDPNRFGSFRLHVLGREKTTKFMIISIHM